MGLREGFVPVGLKEHGGILYVASVNKEGEGEIGTIPSPIIKDIYKDKTVLNIDKNLTDNNGPISTETEISTKLYPAEKFLVHLDMKYDPLPKQITYVKDKTGAYNSTNYKIKRHAEGDNKNYIYKDGVNVGYFAVTPDSSYYLTLDGGDIEIVGTEIKIDELGDVTEIKKEGKELYIYPSLLNVNYRLEAELELDLIIYEKIENSSEFNKEFAKWEIDVPMFNKKRSIMDTYSSSGREISLKNGIYNLDLYTKNSAGLIKCDSESPQTYHLKGEMKPVETEENWWVSDSDLDFSQIDLKNTQLNGELKTYPGDKQAGKLSVKTSLNKIKKFGLIKRADGKSVPFTWKNKLTRGSTGLKYYVYFPGFYYITDNGLIITSIKIDVTDDFGKEYSINTENPSWFEEFTSNRIPIEIVSDNPIIIKQDPDSAPNSEGEDPSWYCNRNFVMSDHSSEYNGGTKYKLLSLMKTPDKNSLDRTYYITSPTACIGEQCQLAKSTDKYNDFRGGLFYIGLNDYNTWINLKISVYDQFNGEYIYTYRFNPYMNDEFDTERYSELVVGNSFKNMLQAGAPQNKMPIIGKSKSEKLLIDYINPPKVTGGSQPEYSTDGKNYSKWLSGNGEKNYSNINTFTRQPQKNRIQTSIDYNDIAYLGLPSTQPVRFFCDYKIKLLDLKYNGSVLYMGKAYNVDGSGTMTDVVLCVPGLEYSNKDTGAEIHPCLNVYAKYNDTILGETENKDKCVVTVMNNSKRTPSIYKDNALVDSLPIEKNLIVEINDVAVDYPSTNGNVWYYDKYPRDFQVGKLITFDKVYVQADKKSYDYDSFCIERGDPKTTTNLDFEVTGMIESTSNLYAKIDIKRKICTQLNTLFYESSEKVSSNETRGSILGFGDNSPRACNINTDPVLVFDGEIFDTVTNGDNIGYLQEKYQVNGDSNHSMSFYTDSNPCLYVLCAQTDYYPTPSDAPTITITIGSENCSYVYNNCPIVIFSHIPQEINIELGEGGIFYSYPAVYKVDIDLNYEIKGLGGTTIYNVISDFMGQKQIEFLNDFNWILKGKFDQYLKDNPNIYDYCILLPTVYTYMEMINNSPCTSLGKTYSSSSAKPQESCEVDYYWVYDEQECFESKPLHFQLSGTGKKDYLLVDGKKISLTFGDIIQDES